MRVFDRQLVRIVQVPDKLQEERIKRILTKFQELIQSNINYFAVKESLTETLVKLATKSPAVAQALAKN